MARLIKLYRLANLLSVDVVIGAVCSGVFIASVLNKPVQVSSLICLALTVWIIYTVDHLIDAKSINGVASTERHRFHQQHFYLLLVAIFIAVIVEGCLLFTLPKQVLIQGLIATPILVVYFFLQKRLTFVKEFFIAVVYTAGLLITSASLQAMFGPKGLFIASYFAIALMNLLLFSLFDMESDRRDRHVSFALSSGVTITQIVFVMLFSVPVFLIALKGAKLHVLIVLAMAVCLLVIMAFRKFFIRYGRYRLLGDAVFYFPAIYLLLW